MIPTRRRRLALAALALTLFAACHEPTGPRIPAALQIVDGDLQSDTVGHQLPQALVVRVTDDKGKPVSGTLVNFVVVDGGGAMFAGSGLTDDAGEVRDRWQLGTVAGDTQRVEARAVSSTGAPIVFATFRAVGVAGAPARVVAEAPPTPTAALGTAVDGALVARVVDAHGNGVPGAGVTWSVGGGGSLAGAGPTTDAQGRARATWTLGTQWGAEQTVDVAATGVAQPVRFTAVPTLAGATVQVVGGNNQTGIVGQALPQPVVVEVRGPGGQPLSGVPISLSHSAGTSITPSTPVTDAQGRAELTWTLAATPGAASGFAAVNVPVGTAGATFHATAGFGPPATVVIVTPAPDFTLPSGWSVPPVEVEVRDAFGNPLSGVPVVWTVTAGGGRIDTDTTHTRANGRSSNVWYVGPVKNVRQRLQAQVGSLAPVQFTTITDEFFFRIHVPPSPGPGATVTGPTLRVAATNYPLGTHSQGQNVASFTLTVADRTVNLTEVSWAYWTAEVSLAGLAPGTHTYTLYAVDGQGRTHRESVTFTYAP